MKFSLIVLLLMLVLAGCVTGDKVRQGVREGMTKEQVISTLGNPDGFKRSGDSEALTYVNRLISGWSWDRTDYTVILENGHVTQFGPGQVRQEGPNFLIVVPVK
ncbi:hypothetical protein [Rudaea sp.]|uniref:hypothetical protein n=1 Tax=Rudaea sp. TaxID=2136325 RepID=UPI002ED3112C